ncbi:hypothetical protein [Pedobacter sp. L105]|uniref:hypothetical protein n=1 Tax=Pedobacter sp. L105 TaxID=1641871 RepID=UPI00131A8047|nr:hypothetical protein [Pedobacter sp. L105]
MSATKRIANQIANHAGIIGGKSKSHANDPYVLKKVEQAKIFMSKAGLPDIKK